MIEKDDGGSLWFLCAQEGDGVGNGYGSEGSMSVTHTHTHIYIERELPYVTYLK